MANPGVVASGAYHGGKFYEMRGGEPAEVYNADQVKVLSPVSKPPSLRFFPRPIPAPNFLPDEADSPSAYFYLNPITLSGPGSGVPYPHTTREVGVEVALAAIIGGQGMNAPVDRADEMLLGFAPAAVFFAADWRETELRLGRGIGRSYDIGVAIGPAITTPDELFEFSDETPTGRIYDLELALRLENQEIVTTNVATLPYTIAQCVHEASQVAPLQSGDVLLIGLETYPEDRRQGGFLRPKQEVVVFSERLGTLFSGLFELE